MFCFAPEDLLCVAGCHSDTAQNCHGVSFIATNTGTMHARESIVLLVLGVTVCHHAAEAKQESLQLFN